VPTAQRLPNGRVRVTWNGVSGRAALIRDSRTGDILSVARGGAVEFRTSSDFASTWWLEPIAASLLHHTRAPPHTQCLFSLGRHMFRY
jgi:hypothetical protein